MLMPGISIHRRKHCRQTDSMLELHHASVFGYAGVGCNEGKTDMIDTLREGI